MSTASAVTTYKTDDDRYAAVRELSAQLPRHHVLQKYLEPQRCLKRKAAYLRDADLDSVTAPAISGGHVLELGMGAGWLAHLITRNSDGRRRVDGLDLPASASPDDDFADVYDRCRLILGARCVYRREIKAQVDIGADIGRYAAVVATEAAFHAGWQRCDWEHLILDVINNHLLVNRVTVVFLHVNVGEPYTAAAEALRWLVADMVKEPSIWHQVRGVTLRGGATVRIEIFKKEWRA